MNILVVDDESQYRMLVGDFLKEKGHTPFLAEHGQAAMDIIDDQQIDFIISDVYMPVMDGLRFYKELRKKSDYNRVPFLFVSAYDDDYTLTAVRWTKYDGFLRKARPLKEMTSWIDYLITPPEKRSKTPPGETSKATESTTRNSRRTPPRR